MARFRGFEANFVEAMDDDLNTADGLSALFDLTREINTALAQPRSKAFCEEAAKMFDAIADVLGIPDGEEPEGRAAP